MKPIFCRQSENVYVKIFILEILSAVFRFVSERWKLFPFSSSSDLRSTTPHSATLQIFDCY